MQQVTEEAMEQTNFQSETNPITQDNKPAEMPVQPEPDIQAQPVRRSIQLQDRLSVYFSVDPQQQPTSTETHYTWS